MIKEKIEKHFKSIIVTAILTIIAIISWCVPSSVTAAIDLPHWTGDENGGMPECKLTPPTGLFPQILYSGRKFSGQPDTQFPYESWSIEVSSGMVYCAAKGSILRFGWTDPNIYYPSSGGKTYADFVKAQESELEYYAKATASKNGWHYISTNSMSVGYEQSSGTPIDTSKPIFITSYGRTYTNTIRNELVKIHNKLAGPEKPPALSGNGWENYNHSQSISAYDGGSAEFGPKVCVMESGVGNRGYSLDESGTATNDQMAFILTTMEDVYSSKKYDEQDIQTAYWILRGSPTSAGTSKGVELKQRAEEYEKFVQEIREGYKATIDNSNAQIIVNQESENYIVGPFTTTYPEYQDISYIKALYIKSEETGKTLVYDENNNDLEILCQTGSPINNNGLKKVYPSSGEYFYIKFSAEKAGYPKNVELFIDYEYLAKTQIDYNNLKAQANIYQYFGYVNEGGEHPIRMADGTGTISFTYESYDFWYKDADSEWWDEEGNKHTTTGKSHYHWVSHTGSLSIAAKQGRRSVPFVQPYIQMGAAPVQSLTGQPLTAALEGERTYAIEEASVPIDLTFELGGKVWVDGTAGKESAYDGIFNTATDKPMPNVKVSLYQVKGLDGNVEGKFISATTTDENGEYLFKNQNSMFQYYVKFTYNGQYYQPTIYNADKNDANWINNSKGLDILQERDTFNAKFREIGSAPENTVGCETACEIHTRQELQDAGLIDEFGNIPGELDADGNRKSSDNYVNYSMMDSYTCNGTSTKDLYPGIQIFVIDTFLNNLSNTQEVLTFVGSQEIAILYGNPDLIHHINQGYVLRELVDLALRKDVYKTTLEINGKTQVYKYNKREGLETDENGNSYWEIKTRISDGYYNYEYSRELYREDYDYKVGNYSIVNDTTTLDNLGLSEDSELKIYVTYKFTIRNRSEAIAAAITEVVDYYDEDYTYVQERSYLGDNAGNKIGDVYLKDSSRYGEKTQTTIAGYKNLYITGDQEYSNVANDTVTNNMFPLSDPDSNKDVYFYVTFMVNKDAERNILLDEDVASGTAKGVGKENIAEINGYKSYYGEKAHAPNTGNSRTQQEYTTGDIAGIPDCNSTPGNLNPTDVPKDGAIKYENFENDTDKAPNIRIILNRDNLRTVEGTVFEDTRNVDEQNAKVGDGVKNNETGINGVRVQLVELRQGQDGKTYEYIWKEVLSGNTDSTTPIINNSGLVPNYSIDTANADGKYKFTSFAPGNYIVRFIYGSGESTVLGTTYTNYNNGNEEENPVTNLYASQEGYNKRTEGSGYSASSANIGLNKNSYNGQDYKSTSYQVRIDNGTGAYTNNSSTSYTYNFSAADGGLYSDAKDIMSKNDNVVNIAPNANYLVNCNNARNNVNAYSRGETQEDASSEVKNHLAEILASYESIPEYNYIKYTAEEMKNLLNEFMNNTYMVAESGTIDVNFEYNRTGNEDNVTNTSGSGHDNIGSENYQMAGYYVLKDLDLGLVQRPKAQLKVTKQITNVKLTLANGSTLFDASDKATNVLWIPHTAHGKDTQNTYETKNNYKNNNMMKNPIVRQQSANKGKVQLTMDEELMHGSTLQITYAITVANVGEVDYNENQFYYTGRVADTSTIVKTDPKVLVDYVGTQVHDYNSADDNSATRNNLQFNKAQNPDWNAISSDDLLNNGLLNSKLSENVKKYTDGHIITTTAASKGLIPIIADQSNVKEIANAFKNDPMHALDTVKSTQSVSGVQLVLTQMITQDSSSDDRIYNNMTELVTTQNTVGRKMSYSVVGNQDPTMEPREIDADDSQEVVILPPFGQKYIYYVLGTAVAVILIAGIVVTIIVVKKKK